MSEASGWKLLCGSVNLDSHLEASAKQTSTREVSKSGLGGKPGEKNQVLQSRELRVDEAAALEEKKSMRAVLNSYESMDRRAKVRKYLRSSREVSVSKC